MALEASVADSDPGSGDFLTPGSGIRGPGWVKNQESGSTIRIQAEQPGSYFRDFSNNFLG